MKHRLFLSPLSLCALLWIQPAPVYGADSPESSPFRVVFPVYTEQMRLSVPGTVKKMLHMRGALFFVGDDRHSRDWLKRSRAQLVREKARGLVVQVRSSRRLAELRALVPELQMFPVHIDEIVDYFNIRVYPSLLLGGVR